MQDDLSRPPQLLAALHRRSALVRRIVNARARAIRAVAELFAAPRARGVCEGAEAAGALRGRRR